MQRIPPRLMHSITQAIHNEAVPMPLIFRPSSSRDIRSRQLGHLCSHELSIDKQLHVDTSPRISIINPTGNAPRVNNSFTPTMKRRWKQLRVNDNRKRADKDRLED